MQICLIFSNYLRFNLRFYLIMNEPFEPRIFVNGSMLRQFIGQNISIILQIVEEVGSNITSMSTDDQKIHVTIPDHFGANKGDWIEVMGKPTGPASIRANEAILLGDASVNFDKDSYNAAVLFMKNCKEIFRYE